MKTIKLSEKVIVSDPCYENPTWCQKKLDDVLSGNYVPFVKVTDNTDGWGRRNSVISVIHEDYTNKDLKWTHVKNADIGVDSGQCGIFSLETYRNNESLNNYEWINGKSPFNGGFTTDGSEEDKWYEKMCDLTLSTENNWGSYDNGVVSSSGYGDGSYNLYVSRVKGKVVGIMVDFLVEEEVDKSFYIR
jgi:hypothetical protein